MVGSVSSCLRLATFICQTVLVDLQEACFSWARYLLEYRPSGTPLVLSLLCFSLAVRSEHLLGSKGVICTSSLLSCKTKIP